MHAFVRFTRKCGRAATPFRARMLPAYLLQAGLVVCKNPRTEFRFPDQKTVPKTGSENGPDFGTGAPAAHSRYAILTLRVKNAVRAYLYRSGSQAPVSWFCSRTNVFQLRCHRPQINC